MADDSARQVRSAPPSERDLYAVLGLTSTASHDDIRRAFKRLSLECHPDRTAANASDDERTARGSAYKAVTEAHEWLGDAERRARYDAARLHAATAHTGFAAPFGAGVEGRGKSSLMQRARAAALARFDSTQRSDVLAWAHVPLKQYMVGGDVPVECYVLVPCDHEGYANAVCFMCEEGGFYRQPYTARVRVNSQRTVPTGIVEGVFDVCTLEARSIGVAEFATCEGEHAPVLRVRGRRDHVSRQARYEPPTPLPAGVTAQWYIDDMRPPVLQLWVRMSRSVFAQYVCSRGASVAFHWFDDSVLPVADNAVFFEHSDVYAGLVLTLGAFGLHETTPLCLRIDVY
jgi:hypothetical protein